MNDHRSALCLKSKRGIHFLLTYFMGKRSCLETDTRSTNRQISGILWKQDLKTLKMAIFWAVLRRVVW